MSTSVAPRPRTRRQPPASAPRTGGYRRRRSLANHLLVVPALLLSALVVVVPGVLTALASFTDWNGTGFQASFVGLRNFTAILDDPVFATALRNNVIWVVLFLTLPAIVGLLTAWLLLRRRRTRTLYQVVYLMPYVLAPVVNALVWLSIIYSPEGGVVAALNGAGLHVTSPLSSLHGSLYAAAAVDMWHYWGFLTVVYLGALRQTPVEQVEAAIVDGANAWQVFRHVYLPSIRPTLLLMGVMTVIFSFLAFDYVYLLTQGGPAHSSEVMGTYAYAFAFSAFEFGKASAVGVIMSFFGLIASCVYTWMSRRQLT
ncbi:sugar ABC transporter permease [Streptomyces sp. NPDC004542]|uniref:carbohydrate ABC transporter permease n=1 Tax=Streptomyces sp. NPDC004542 TaxID=3154281 RepID=UPI0033ADA77E